MEAVADNKDEICKALWLECKDDLTKLCKHKLSSHPDEVEDVIADAFYYLCVAVFEDKKIENYKAWLFGVANNLIKIKYTEINRRSLRNIEFNEEEIETYKFSQDVFLDSLISDSVIEKIADEIICDLKPNEQELYSYVYKDKLKMREIAALLNITEVNAKQRNHRLSKKLKAKIKEHLEQI